MKKMGIFTMLLMFSVCLTAQEQTGGKSGLRLSSALSIGLLNGAAEEIVYNEKGSDDKVSQLLWYMNPLVYRGFDINLDWHKPKNRAGFFFGISAKIGFPAETGIMEDRDWIGADSSGAWLPDVLTHYSVHDNNTDKSALVNMDIGVSFRLFEKFLLKTSMTYNVMDFSWTARGGSFLYPSWDQGHGYLLDSRRAVITYSQTWQIISPGIAFYGQFNRFFDIDLSLKMSPFIWCDAVDQHLLRYLTIKESMDSGFFIEPKLVFSFTPTESLALSLTVSYTNISGVRGDSEYTERGKQTITYPDIGGAGYHAFDIGLSLRYRLVFKQTNTGHLYL